MAVNIITSGTIGVSNTGAGDINIVREGIYRVAEFTAAFDFVELSGTLRVDGLLYGATGVTSSGFTGDADYVVTIGSTGVVEGDSTGILMDGGDTADVTNHGEVTSAFASGVFLSTDEQSAFLNTGIVSGRRGVSLDVTTFEVTNSGSVFGDEQGIRAFFSSGSLTNSGHIEGALSGIEFTSSSSGSLVLNSGTISSGGVAVQMGDGNDTLSNTGTLIGRVELGDGSDVLDSRLGTINGSVFLEGGDDIAILGSEDNFVDGRAGADLIRGGGGDDTIQGGSGDDELRGGAGDDDIIGEDSDDEVYGGHGDDSLRGNAGADRLFGGTGNDVLAGGSGDDRLNGGRGDDVMTGNGGEDLFIFNRQAGNDEITDFNDGVDLIDLRAFDVSAGDVLDATSVVGGNSIIDLEALGGTGTILIEGDTSMSAGDFLV